MPNSPPQSDVVNPNFPSGGGGGAAEGPSAKGSPSPAASSPLAALNDLESHFTALKQMHAEVLLKEARLAEHTKELAARQREMDELAALVDADRESLAKDRADAESRLQTALDQATAAEEAERALSARAEELEAKAREFVEEETKLRLAADQVRAHRTKLQERSEAVEEREEALEKRHRELDDAAEQRIKALDERERLLAERAASGEGDQNSLHEELAFLRDQADSAAREAADAKSRAESLTAELERAAKASAAQAAEAAERSAKTAAALAASEEEAAKLRSSLDHAREELRQARESAAGTAGAVVHEAADYSKYEQAITLLGEKLKQSEAARAELRERMEGAAGSPAAAASASGAGGSGGTDTAREVHLARRYERLVKYKSLLQTQMRKIVAAQNTLAKRQSETEQILALRSKIVAATAELKHREQVLQKRQARSATGALLFYSIAGLGVLLALSWAAAYKLAPAVYAARTILIADVKSKKPSETDVLSWQQYMLGLADDPNLMETTAQRLDRRGLNDLATGAALRAELKNTLYVDSSSPLQINIELRGARPQRTEMVLDTLATAMVSEANAGRNQRPDGLAAEVSHPAALVEGAISDQRIAYAAGIFGGTAGTAILSAILIAKLLGRMRRRNEADELIDDEHAGIGPPDSDRSGNAFG